MADRTGQQLGNYRLTRLLGRGGFAEVYLGEHIYLETFAAIKVLHTQLSHDDADLFRTEARTIARLVHPHIVRVLEFGIEDATPFLVVDYAPNGTLRKQYPKGVALALPLIVNYVKQIAEALQYAHEHRVIHRDVKPENMLIGARHEILLSDFGIAIMAQSTHYNSTHGIEDMAGTIAYMAPEQIQAQPLFQSDQYALGVVVYEWLSGARPFHGTFTEIAVKQTLVLAPPLRDRRPDLSAEIEAVMTKVLAKDPQQRYETVLDFARALEQACQQEAGYEEAQKIIQAYPGQIPPEVITLNPSSLPSLTSAIADAGEQAESSTTALLPAAAPPASTESLESPEPPVQAESTGSPEPVKETSTLLVLPSSTPARSLTRRAVITGLASATILAAGGTIIVLAQQKNMPGTLSTSSSNGQGTRLITYRGHNDFIWAVAWSPNGKYIASASKDQTVQVWNAATGDHIYTYTNHTDSIYGIAWSKDSTRIASASYDKTVQVWRALDGTYPQIYTGHSAWVWSVTWSPTGDRIASGGGDKTVQVWNPADASTLYTYKDHTAFVSSVAWSPNGTYLASASADQTAQVADANSAQLIYAYQPYATSVWSVAWSPDSKRIVSGCADKTVQLWDATNGDHHYTYYGHTDFVSSVAWSPDGKYIASGGDDKSVQIWNATDGSNAYSYTGHSNAIRGISWSPDGKYIASASWDKTVQVWQAI